MLCLNDNFYPGMTFLPGYVTSLLTILVWAGFEISYLGTKHLTWVRTCETATFFASKTCNDEKSGFSVFLTNCSHFWISPFRITKIYKSNVSVNHCIDFRKSIIFVQALYHYYIVLFCLGTCACMCIHTHSSENGSIHILHEGFCLALPKKWTVINFNWSLK
jgi:hypothetical protein